MMIILLICLFVIILFIIDKIFSSYKISYYEQTFKNNKSLFSESRYKKIEDVMNIKLFEFKKLK